MKTNIRGLELQNLFMSMALVTCFGVQATAGNSDGGGGGGICIEKKCMTLAQAGLTLKKSKSGDNYFLPNKELRSEVRRIVESLPGRQYDHEIMLRNIFGTSETFSLVEKSNDKKFKTALKEYKKILTEYGAGVDANKVELLAFSSVNSSNVKNGKTYLLPEFFNLDLQGQALILIHEERIRDGHKLIDVLKFDVELVAWIGELNRRTNANEIDLISSMAQLRLLTNTGASSLYFQGLQKLLSQQTPTLDELCGDDAVEFLRSHTKKYTDINGHLGERLTKNFICTPKPEVLMEIGDISKTAYRLLSGVNFNADHVVTTFHFRDLNGNIVDVKVPETWGDVESRCSSTTHGESPIIISQLPFENSDRELQVLYDCKTKVSYTGLVFSDDSWYSERYQNYDTDFNVFYIRVSN